MDTAIFVLTIALLFDWIFVGLVKDEIVSRAAQGAGILITCCLFWLAFIKVAWAT